MACADTESEDRYWSKVLTCRLSFFTFAFLCRHTSNLENFTSLILKYAPIRVAYDFQYYRSRMHLAAENDNQDTNDESQKGELDINITENDKTQMTKPKKESSIST